MSTSEPRRSRLPRVGLAVVVALLLLVGGVGWYYSGEILAVEPPEQVADELVLPSDETGPDVRRVMVPGPLGDYPALHLDGDDDTWIVFVHGRGGEPQDGLHLLPLLAERGHPALLITYRNDQAAPPAPDGRYRLGWTEWEDLDAAVDWALERGAEDVVLVGYSMGGAIVGRYLLEEADAPVRGVVLDAPVVRWSLALEAAAVERGVPTALTPLAQGVVSLRTGLRWGQLDLLERVDELDDPILLFHGDADTVVPIEGSEELAAARPDLVEYVRVPGAAHVRSWETDPDGYEKALLRFLDDIGA